MKSKWKTKRLGDISTINYGYTAKASFNKADSLFLRITDIQDNFVDWKTVPYCSISEIDYEKYKLIDNDIVFARTGATTGKSYLIKKPPKSVAASYLIRLRLTDCDILPEFIAKYFQTPTYWNDISLGIVGSAQGGFNASKLSDLIIPVPPIEEQKRIVEILDKAFEGIAQAEANTRRNLINARELFDSYLNSALIGFVLQETPQILADITELIIDCEHKTAPTQEMGYPSIRTPNIGKGYLTLDNVYRVSEETYQEWTRRAKPQANDLILAREAPAGNVGIVPEGEKVCLGQRTVLIRPKKTINSQYLAFYLLHPEMQKQLLSKSSGATVQHVNMKDIRSLKISYFPSMEVQQKLAEALQSIQSRSKQLETIYQRKLEAIAELKQSILEKAFTGQLSQ
jgi:type I restriction enzyme S subunit